MALHLVIRRGGAAGESRTMQGRQLSIGRGPENDWVLADPDAFLSTEHCIVGQDADGYWVTDTSLNGVFINDAVRPVGRGVKAVLHDGDVIGLGDYRIEARLDTSEAKAAHGFAANGRPPAPVAQETFAQPFGTGTPLFDETPRSMSREPMGRDAPMASGDALVPPDLLSGYSPGLSSNFGAGLAPPGSGNQGQRSADSLVPQDLLTHDGSENWPRHEETARSMPADPFQSARSEHHAPMARSFADFGTPKPPASSGLTAAETYGSGILAAPGSEALPAKARSIIPTDWMSPGAATEETLPAPPEVAETTVAFPVTPRQGVAVETPVIPPASPSATPSAPSSIPEVAPSPEAEGLLAAFLRGVGVDLADDDPTLPATRMEVIGRSFRAMAKCMLEILQSRAQIKRDYRIEHTILQAQNNNPLKFSATLDELLPKLIGPSRPGYLSPEQAVDEAVSDIAGHEMALLTAMQAGVEGLIERLEPERLRRRLDRGSMLDRLLPARREARYWALFEQQYREIAAEMHEDFRGTFGRTFARAYQEQVARLRRL